MNRPVAVKWSTPALERVAEISDYLDTLGDGMAEAWIDGLFAKMDEVAYTPRMGRVVPELERDEVREVFYKQYRVIYRVDPSQLAVLTVRHMKQRLDEEQFGNS
ncbi:MAG: type II toxin-antitoxin system RelE/ParE family toxin [Bacteroidota bacterium]